MKKIALTALAALSVLGLVACSSQSSSKPADSSAMSKNQKPQVVKVAAHVYPMIDMLELIQDDMAAEGYTLEIVKVSDNVQANVALQNKEVDANLFQHKPFMELYNEGNGANLVQVQPVYTNAASFYAKDFDKIEDLPNGADVAIPSDPSNMARALRLLAEHQIISLDNDGYAVNTDNIVDNPKQLTFTPVGLLNLNDAYQEKDMIFNYPTYISKIGLTPTKDGLIFEAEDDITFAASLVAREDNQNTPEIKALKKYIASDEIRHFIDTKLQGHAKPAF